AINSVLFQTYPYFELIIIDDGSSDSSIQVVENINDSRIKLFKQSNSGVSAARNKGIEIAKYELIAFLDADDWWGENYLKSMLELSLKYPEVSIYGSHYAIVQNKKINPSISFFNDSIKDISFDLLDLVVKNKNFMLPLHSSSFIIRKAILEKTSGFDSRIKYFEDYDLFLRISLFSKVAYLNTSPLSFYVQDVPDNNRATGRLPSINDHMVYYLDKFIPLYNKNKNLKIYIDKFKLWSLLNYRNNILLKDEVNRIRRDVNIKNYSWKYIILYNTPTILASFLIKINIRFFRNNNNNNDTV
ncbi:glycosyltransferase, partial [Flavobacteriaceae bacterium]|nr:glycosyltransferase [Flavobacteriaceae bacterium]